VPITLGYLDYAKKEGGIGKVIFPDGDMEGKMKEIMAFYFRTAPKHQAKFY
jgi:hypothetical protein